MASTEIQIDGDRFWRRAARFRSTWLRHKHLWGNADAVSISLASLNDDEMTYSKTSAVHQHLLGYEFNSTVMVFTPDELHVLTSSKKAQMLAPLQEHAAAADAQLRLVLHHVSKDDGNAANFAQLVKIVRRSRVGGKRVGVLVKDLAKNPGKEGNVARSWNEHLDVTQGLDKVDVLVGVSALLAAKDASELDNCRKAAVMTNKVLKHGFLKDMQDIFAEEGKTATHLELATKIEDLIDNPDKINVKVPKDTIESCFLPIVQSGGAYDIRPTASTDEGQLSEDVVICCLGARYKSYCANVARTFCIDPVPKVERTYRAAHKLFDECLAVMQPGEALAAVHERAREFLGRKHADLVKLLPKSLGFSLGLDFKDSVFQLTGKVDRGLKFAPGMVFNLAVGFANVPLSPSDVSRAKGEVKKLNTFSVLIADTVLIKEDGLAEPLTKASKEWYDVSFFIREDDGEEQDGSSDEMEVDGENGEAAEADEGTRVRTAAGYATVLKSRLRDRSTLGDDVTERRIKRGEEQAKLHQKKIERGLKMLKDGIDPTAGTSDKVMAAAEDFKAFPSSDRYPSEVSMSTILVDMENQVVFLPINGQPVPFHISTIKSVVMPDPDRAAYLRINFFTPGQALGKDAPRQTAGLIEKYKQSGEFAFVKEFTFRSLDVRGLSQSFRLIQELRKRARQSEAQAAQEADLVVQAKLIKMRDQRIPRLADLTMRPPLSGRKTVGNLDAHTNGLRFSTTRSAEVVDILYSNIKHAFFQPCQNEIMVVIHFHLLNPILVGKKKTQDIQFITEVIEASEALDKRSSMYDPDEIEEEQRERRMRKELNSKFRDFTNKVKAVAARHSFVFEFDIPYRELAFNATPHREMVTLQPSVNCLVNLTEMPFFVVDMSEVEHAHFERLEMSGKNFDLVFVMKDLNQPVKTVSAVDMKDLDSVQDWLTGINITTTVSKVNYNWKQMTALVKSLQQEGSFWASEDPDGERKAPGWYILDAGAQVDSESEEEEESEFEQESEEASESEESEEDEESEFDEEEESEFDEEEEEEADGQSWEELEREARASDRAKDAWDGDEEDRRPAKKARKGR